MATRSTLTLQERSRVLEVLVFLIYIFNLIIIHIVMFLFDIQMVPSGVPWTGDAGMGYSVM